MFPEMHTIVPEGESGDVQIRHFDIDENTSRHSALGGGATYTPTGRYVRLSIGGVLMMTDVRHEKVTNTDVVLASHGRVLIAGLGLGMIIHAIARRPTVESITVVELNPHVRKLVEPTLPRTKPVCVVDGNIFTWEPPHKFNTIYFDIWAELGSEALREMDELHKRYRKHLVPRSEDPGRWMDSWERTMLKRRERSIERVLRTNLAPVGGDPLRELRICHISKDET